MTLSVRQKQCLDFITKAITDKGSAPTVREIGSHMGIRSPNGVMCHLKALEKKGVIERDGFLSRGIRVKVAPGSVEKIIERISRFDSHEFKEAIIGKLKEERTSAVVFRWLDEAMTAHMS